MEPHKCEGWFWKSWDDVLKIYDAAQSGASAERLFLPIENLIKQTRNIHHLLPKKGEVSFPRFWISCPSSRVVRRRY